jgi:hypothetical protein
VTRPNYWEQERNRLIWGSTHPDLTDRDERMQRYVLDRWSTTTNPHHTEGTTMTDTKTAKQAKPLLGKNARARAEALLAASSLLGGTDSMFTPKRMDRPIADVLDLAEYILHGDVTVRHVTKRGVAVANLNRGVARNAGWTQNVATPTEDGEVEW